MNLAEAMKARHSVRQYQNKPLETETIAALQAEIAACNQESGLHIQLVTNEPKAFDGFMAHYGKFSGVIPFVFYFGLTKFFSIAIIKMLFCRNLWFVKMIV